MRLRRIPSLPPFSSHKIIRSSQCGHIAKEGTQHNESGRQHRFFTPVKGRCAPSTDNDVEDGEGEDENDDGEASRRVCVVIQEIISMSSLLLRRRRRLLPVLRSVVRAFSVSCMAA